ncbi:MAG: GNAT family N-acetyltransferase [Jatrophihabitantaceae bacterium]
MVPFLLLRAPVDCRLGEYNVVRFRPRMLLPAGDEPALGEDAEAWHGAFSALLTPRRELNFDALRIAAPTDSWLWGFIQRTAWKSFGICPYQPAAPVMHQRIAMPTTFEAYAAKFTAKTRGNRHRELKNLKRCGTVELACYRGLGEVEVFLEQAMAISRRSYQHRLLGVGMPAPERLRPRLEVAARQGWLRSYVLHCGGAACSYMLGYQYGGRYHYMAVGYDPAWKPFSVGTVLQWLVLQEMCAHDGPAAFDFGTAAPQTEYFGNDSFEEGTLLLFRRGIRPWLIRQLHQGGRQTTRLAVQILEHYRLKAPVQQFLRRLRGC